MFKWRDDFRFLSRDKYVSVVTCSWQRNFLLRMEWGQQLCPQSFVRSATSSVISFSPCSLTGSNFRHRNFDGWSWGEADITNVLFCSCQTWKLEAISHTNTIYSLQCRVEFSFKWHPFLLPLNRLPLHRLTIPFNWEVVGRTSRMLGLPYPPHISRKMVELDMERHVCLFFSLSILFFFHPPLSLIRLFV